MALTGKDTVIGCEHVATLPGSEPSPSSPDGCEECLAVGERLWAHLRMCLVCGHVGCCESSPRRHAEAHFGKTSHPVMRSFEPGETWRWCYVDDRIV
jgi:uncharacterized UBP type Zn finger protein